MCAFAKSFETNILALQSASQISQNKRNIGKCMILHGEGMICTSKEIAKQVKAQPRQRDHPLLLSPKMKKR